VCGDGIKQTGEGCDEGSTSAVGATGTATCLAGCVLASCGDGVKQVGEECDNGTKNSDTGACSTKCISATCGDGVVRKDITDPAATGYEVCDDGNNNNADACTNSCKAPACGDSIVQSNEVCDEGAASAVGGVGSATCAPGCKSPSCGDGVKGTGEECDLGAASNLDTATTQCTAKCKLPACGDGVVDTVNGVLEECDLGAGNGPNATCTASCKANICGDGFKSPSEVCDDGANNVAIGSTLDGTKCTTACARPTCGDGTVQTGEECDDKNTNNFDSCLNNCKKNVCGDGYRHFQIDGGTSTALGATADGYEECDDGNTVDKDSCTAKCKAPTCGDGVVYDTLETTTTAARAISGNSSTWPLALTGVNSALTGAAIGHAEECDNGVYSASNPNGNTANGACRLDCTANLCGDGKLGPNEDCDGALALTSTHNGQTCVAATCKYNACGDGVIGTSVASGTSTPHAEECDLGTANSDTGACTTQCKVAYCGDGIIGAGESCDWGSAGTTTSTGTGFIAEKLPAGVASGTTCTNKALPITGLIGPCALSTCGDGNVDTGEACDDGKYDATTNPNGNGHGTSKCTNACTLNICGDRHIVGSSSDSHLEICDNGPWNGNGSTSSTSGIFCSNACLPNRCGDGFKADTEACDDGASNGTATSRCSKSCTLAYCGDGLINYSNGISSTAASWVARTEECDDGNAVDGDACTRFCKKNVCGDGIIGLGESCDPGLALTSTLVDAGVTCLSTCALSTCGDGVKQAQAAGEAAHEECDDGSNNGTTGSACTARCMAPRCGDGVANKSYHNAYSLGAATSTEDCDDGGNTNGDSVCEADCTLPICGNGVLDPGEECEYNNLVTSATASSHTSTSITATPWCTAACKKQCNVAINASGAAIVPTSTYQKVSSTLYNSGESCIFTLVSSTTASSTTAADCPTDALFAGTSTRFVSIDSSTKDAAVISFLSGLSSAPKPWVIGDGTWATNGGWSGTSTAPFMDNSTDPVANGKYYSDWWLATAQPDATKSCVVLSNSDGTSTLAAYHWFADSCSSSAGKATVVCEQTIFSKKIAD
jgi:cysteine-rich repeat protein